MPVRSSHQSLKHAGTGNLEVKAYPDKLQIIVADHGKGIDFSVLPKATLLKGYSTKISMGYGFTIMLDCLSKVLLNTGDEGTTVVLEMLYEKDKTPSTQSVQKG